MPAKREFASGIMARGGFFLILALLLAAWWRPAQAAPSFDCAKAGSVIEKTNCATPALAALDSKLAAT